MKIWHSPNSIYERNQYGKTLRVLIHQLSECIQLIDQHDNTAVFCQVQQRLCGSGATTDPLIQLAEVRRFSRYLVSLNR